LNFIDAEQLRQRRPPETIARRATSIQGPRSAGASTLPDHTPVRPDALAELIENLVEPIAQSQKTARSSAEIVSRLGEAGCSRKLSLVQEHPGPTTRGVERYPEVLDLHLR
jgi:hypothetical protein